MKVYYVRFKNNFWVDFIIAGLLITMVLMLVAKEPAAVFNTYVNTPLYKGDTSKPVVAFACNVVWGTEYIPDMLKLFKENNIKITFFVGGQWAKQNPDLLIQMVSEGHEIGNHGYNHKKPTQLSVEQNKKEILDTERVVSDITGIKTVLFAPPYGDYDERVVSLAKALGYKTIMWSIDTIDWRGDGYQTVINRVLKNPSNGDIILMHPTKDTLIALPTIIRELKRRGLTIGRVSDVI